MAIAFDTITTPANVTATSLTFSHTTTGANRILFVGILTGGGDIVTGVTYAGVSMTLVNKNILASGNVIYLYVLVAPASGANNVVVSQSASAFLDAAAISYTGAKQSGQPDANTTGAGTGTSLTTTLTTIADNSWTVEIFRDPNLNQIPTAGAGTTLRNNTQYVSILDSNGPKTPAGSTSLIANVTSSSTDLGTVMASFAPAINNQTIAVTAAATAGVTKQMNKTLAVTASAVANTTKQLSKTLAVIGAAVAIVTKQLSKTIAVTALGVVAVAATKVTLKTIAVTASAVVGMMRTPGKVIGVTASASVGLTKSVSKVIAVTATALPNLTKQLSKTIDVIATGVVNLVRGRVVTISVTVQGVANLTKQMAKTIGVTASASVGLSVARAKTIAVVASAVAGITKTPGKVIAVVAQGIAYVSTGNPWQRQPRPDTTDAWQRQPRP